jgi:hypothetical protein
MKHIADFLGVNMRKGTFVKFAYFVLIGITIILWAVLTIYDIAICGLRYQDLSYILQI